MFQELRSMFKMCSRLGKEKGGRDDKQQLSACVSGHVLNKQTLKFNKDQHVHCQTAEGPSA